MTVAFPLDNFTDVEDMHPKLHNSYFDVRAHGEARGNGSDDDTGPIQDVINAANVQYLATGMYQTVHFPHATYKISELYVKPGVDVVTDSARLLKSVGAVSSNAFRTDGGSFTNAAALTADAAVNDEAITVASAAGFAAGDWVIIRDATYEFSTLGRNCEMNQIESIAGLTITLKDKLGRNFATASSAEILKVINAPHFSRIQGFRIDIPDGCNGGGIYVGKAAYITVADCELSGFADDPAVTVTDYSMMVQVRDCIMRDGQNLPGGGYAYGAAVYESASHVLIQGCRSDRIREHPVSYGAQYVTYDHNICRNHYDDGINTHAAGSRYITFTNNHIINARGYGLIASWASANAKDTHINISNNTVSQNGSIGISVVGASAALTVDHVQVVGNKLDLGSDYHDGIRVQYAAELTIVGNHIRCSNVAGPGTGNGISLADVDRALVEGNSMYDVSNGVNIAGTATNDVSIVGNLVSGAASYPVYCGTGTHTRLRLVHNVGDTNDAYLPAAPDAVQIGNRWQTTSADELMVLANQNGSTNIRVRNAIGLGNTSASARIELDAFDASGYLGAFPSDEVAGPGAAGAGRVLLGTNSGGTVGLALYASLAGQDIRLYAGSNVEAMRIAKKSVAVGSGGALATTATDGFLYIPTCAGPPTGVPTVIAGTVPLVYDTTNHKLYIYDGGWKGGTVPGAWS